MKNSFHESTSLKAYFRARQASQRRVTLKGEKSLLSFAYNIFFQVDIGLVEAEGSLLKAIRAISAVLSRRSRNMW